MSQSDRSSLAQGRRQALISKIKHRGAKKANIWYVFSPGSRTDFVLVGDLKFELFLACEGDPSVTDARYVTQDIPIHIGDRGYAVSFDAVVRCRDGQLECRDARECSLRDLGGEGSECALELTLKRAAAETLNARYVEFTADDLDALRQRTANWARAIAALGRCRDRDLNLLEHAVATRLRTNGRQSFAQLLDLLADEPPALVIAATVSLLRKRLLASDLDTQTWSGNTQIWACEIDAT